MIESIRDQVASQYVYVPVVLSSASKVRASLGEQSETEANLAPAKHSAVLSHHQIRPHRDPSLDTAALQDATEALLVAIRARVATSLANASGAGLQRILGKRAAATAQSLHLSTHSLLEHGSCHIRREAAGIGDVAKALLVDDAVASTAPRGSQRAIVDAAPVPVAKLLPVLSPDEGPVRVSEIATGATAHGGVDKTTGIEGTSGVATVGDLVHTLLKSEARHTTVSHPVVLDLDPLLVPRGSPVVATAATHPSAEALGSCVAAPWFLARSINSPGTRVRRDAT